MSQADQIAEAVWSYTGPRQLVFGRPAVSQTSLEELVAAIWEAPERQLTTPSPVQYTQLPLDQVAETLWNYAGRTLSEGTAANPATPVEFIAQAIWETADTRQLSTQAPALPVGNYSLEQITQAIWDYNGPEGRQLIEGTSDTPTTLLEELAASVWETETPRRLQATARVDPRPPLAAAASSETSPADRPLQAAGLHFYPLAWIHHDQWWYPHYQSSYVHLGHVHLFLPGFSWENAKQQDAFWGEQQYQFALKETWGPNSGDPNFHETYRLVGKPKWFFRVTELWRRMYIQPWDRYHPVTGDGWVGREGIRWDASGVRVGPFREGSKTSPLWIPNARTLPIEYWRNDRRSDHDRDSYCYQQAKSLAETAGADWDDNAEWEKYRAAVSKQQPSHPDSLYIWPILEYQKIVQLNWQPLPLSTPDVADPAQATNDYGDGYSMSVPIPYRDPTTGFYRSPFAWKPNTCLPAGQYAHNLVKEADQLHYREDLSTSSYVDLPAENGGKLVGFHQPYEQADGRWVQQCLGGIVEARVKVILEHKYGTRYVHWIDTRQLILTEPFRGSDQPS